MKNGFTFFLGLFAALAISWGAIVFGTHAQLGALTPYYDDNEGKSFPSRTDGLAQQGALVYDDLGCASCHTQQVRRPDFGSDVARGWGTRQSYARDYIHQARVQLGESRVGPDLANVGARKTPYDAEDLTKLLYTGSALHPAYKFLYDDRAITGEASSHRLVLRGALAAAPGREIVPTPRAQALVAYLLSLKQTYDYPPEAAQNTIKTPPAEKKAEGHK